MSENEILNYVNSREGKKDKLLMVLQLTWADMKEKILLRTLTTFALTVDETTSVAQSNQSIVSLYNIQN